MPDRRSRLILVLALAGGLAYLVTTGYSPYVGGTAVKVSGILLLAIFVARTDVADRSLFTFALMLSALGDALLYGGSFIAGLSSFLAAHVVYATVFARGILRHGPRGGIAVWLALAVLLMSVLIMSVWLWPDLGVMRAPVLAYMLAIATMAALAQFAPAQTLRLALGALLFVLSDALIAVTRFKMDVPLADYMIWSSYFLGQYLMATGFAAGWRTSRIVTA